MIDAHDELAEREVQELFNSIDTDGSGELDAGELHAMSDRPNSLVVSYATFSGSCSDNTYTNETSCEGAEETWTSTHETIDPSADGDGDGGWRRR